MKLGVLTNLYGNMSADAAFGKLAKMGVEAIEIGCGGYPGRAHCDPEVLLSDEGRLAEWRKMIEKHGLQIAALSVHGNPVHPDREIADGSHKDFCNTVLLAEKLGVDTVVTFSGCPSGSPEDKTPNWVTCPWPNDFLDILEYQWNEVLIPYWKKTAEFAKAHGVSRIAFEMHPGFCVYNPETLLRLRAAVGDVIGANFDPSHLIWQGIDPVLAIRELNGAIYHFHAKDTKLDAYNTAKFGVLDTKPYADVAGRSWVFRAVGFGHDKQYFRDMISALRISGYDRVISIEHEDSLMTVDEGLGFAVEFLKDCIMREPQPTTMHWV